MEPLKHLDLCLRPDMTRVVLRPFTPTVEPRDRHPIDKPRVNHIVDRIVALPPEEAVVQLESVLERFAGRHGNLLEILDTRASGMEATLEPHPVLSVTQRRLVGAYFLSEYSFEVSGVVQPEHRRAPRSMRRIRKWLPCHS